jgi:N-acetylneuraminate synthase
LQAHARSRGIEFLSTAFDKHSLAFLETLDLPFYKVASGELTNGPLLAEFARTGRPLVVSTGMATLSEVEQALAVICYALADEAPAPSFNAIWRCWSEPASRERLQGKVSLLHCTSQYPTEMREVNLKAMDTLSRVFQLPVGYSDHTDGTLIPVAAVARGATIIEKHFTLDRSLPGPDHEASLEPRELSGMVASIRSIALALGDGHKVPQPSEWDTRRAARQNLVAALPIRRGERFTQENVTTSRAGAKFGAMHYWDLLGANAGHHYKVGEVIE